MRNASNVPHGSYVFRQAPLGAGGFVIGMDISADGTRMIHWADVWNGYIRDAGDDMWRLMLRDDNLSSTEWNPRPSTTTTDSGIYSARIAPSNKDVIYCSYNGFIYKTTDGAVTWTRTGAAAKNMESNHGAQRRFNRAIDIHPTDPNTVIYGTNNDGVYYTTNGGTSWAAVSGIASSAVAYSTWDADGKYLVAIDPGNANYVYIFASGTGLYRSTAGVSGTFSLVAGSPASASCLVVVPSGNVFMCQFRTDASVVTNALKKLARGTGSSWTSVAGTDSADQVAVDPANENHIVITEENGGYFKQSYDGGSTWATATWNSALSLFEWTRGDGEIQWVSNRVKRSYPAHLMFDTAVSGKLWMTDGVGIDWSTCPADGVDPTAGDPWVWHDYSQGNEELVPTMGMSSPGNPNILCCWDKPFWRMNDVQEWNNMWAYPVPEGSVHGDGLVSVGQWVDYAGDDPNFMVGIVGQGSNQSGYSTDGGRSWVAFPNTHAGWGGCAAVSTTQNFIITSTNNGAAQYTLDGGETWHNVAFGGLDPVDYWISAYYVVRETIAADKTRPGVFAALVNNIVPQHRTGVTLTVASPCVVTWTGHSLVNGNRVNITTTGGIPTGLTAGTNYYVVNATTDTFQLSATLGGSAINTTGTQSGVHTGNTATDYLGRNIAGLWLTEDGGETWTQKFSGNLQTSLGVGGSTGQYWQCGLTYVPGFSGELLYADHENNANNRLLWSQDDGETWDYFANVTNVIGFGLGLAAPGQTRPALYFKGTYNGVKGFYVTIDWFATAPTLIAARPLNHIGGWGRVTADLNVFGRAYQGIGTQGYGMCDYSDVARAT